MKIEREFRNISQVYSSKEEATGRLLQKNRSGSGKSSKKVGLPRIRCTALKTESPPVGAGRQSTTNSQGECSMKLMTLIDNLLIQYKTHGDVNVMIESLPLDLVEFVHAIDGEHQGYVDLVSDHD